jgi:hypothetical protein
MIKRRQRTVIGLSVLFKRYNEILNIQISSLWVDPVYIIKSSLTHTMRSW